ncbi:hypothetical protein AKJ09_05039 [Labilithrix luteola]|uniref:Uncharacterized protein n=1 Tax=Labilithrix luteola TaxID=1391654 RepID=A0A0K1PXW8_9BACT|nr:hypothetical protein [Labilithrix luteola]AKU98375.1 hypothetical protein AKJ09_05039 [Labilithrix luteola]
MSDLRPGIVTWQRSAESTSNHHVFDSAHPRIHQARQEIFEDGTCSLPIFFDADGREVATNGTPAPERPAHVPAFSALITNGRRKGVWEHGRMKLADGPSPRVGMWTFFFPDGARELVDYGEPSDVLPCKKYDASGVLRVEGAYKAMEGRHAGGGHWSGPLIGVWRFFDERGELVTERDLTHHRVDALDDDELLTFARTRHDVPDGATYVGHGRISTRTDLDHWGLARADGVTFRLTTFTDGRKKAEAQLGTDGALPGPWSFWDPNGKLLARIEFRSFPPEEDGEEEEVAARWQMFAEDGAVLEEVFLPLYEQMENVRDVVLLDEEKLAMLHLLSTIVRLPRTEYYAMAKDIPWTELSDPSMFAWYAFHESKYHVAHLLNALVADAPEIRDGALRVLSTDTVHQGTIYESSARLTPMLLHVASDGRAARSAILALLARYADALPPPSDNEAPWLDPMRKAFRDRAVELGRLANDPDEAVRKQALRLLASRTLSAG